MDTEVTSSGYGDYEGYMADHGDALERAEFDRYNRIASCIVDFLAGRALSGESAYVRQAVHWQIRYMREKGSLAACFASEPVRESFAGYTVERRREDGGLRVFGMPVCPAALQLLRVGGIVSYWI